MDTAHGSAAMKLADVLRSSLESLFRQKSRTSLTVLGVAVGATALAFTLALGVGLREFIETEFRSRAEFWHILVMPKGWNDDNIPDSDVPASKLAMPEAVPAERRDRLRKKIIQEYKQSKRFSNASLVTPAEIEQLRAMPDVAEVRTTRQQSGEVALGQGITNAQLFATPMTGFQPSIESHLLFGRMPNPEAVDECVVNEHLLHLCKIYSDADYDALVQNQTTLKFNVGKSDLSRGKSLANILNPEGILDEVNRSQTELLAKIAEQLPKKLDQFDLTENEKTLIRTVMSLKPKAKDPLDNRDVKVSRNFKIVGIMKLPDIQKFDPLDLLGKPKIPISDIIVPTAAGDHLVRDMPLMKSLGYSTVEVMVKPGADLEAVVKTIEEMGLKTTNSIRFYKSVRREVTLISAGLNLFAFISMFVAAIGITNTLFTSVLERTKEIGIWKSLGARDGHILLMFLIEGSLIGLFGGVLGLGLAWLLSLPADEWVKQTIAMQRSEELVSKTVFNWPIWLPLAVVAFSTLLTTLAALYPARRASRVQPVEALRHE
jgi:putative ABC transport system permease protein